ncbi:MAG: hypothetical protein QOJ32_2352 [Frankiaceae bacterium]|nr:hypothetical protein [Frankiaceae bacterium]
MDLDTRRLAVLAAIGRGGSVTAAAQLLYITPSAVSQAVAALERQTGLTLLDRGPRGSLQTRAGELLSATSDRIQQELAGVEQDLAVLTGELSGSVTLTAGPVAIRHVLAPALNAMAETHPAIWPRVVDHGEVRALEALRAGSVDVVVVDRDPEGEPGVTVGSRYGRGLAAGDLLDDPYLVVVPWTWPAPSTLADLSDRPWVDGRRGSPARRALDRLATAHGLQLRRVHECHEFPAVLALVAAGLGAAVVPRLALVDVDLTDDDPPVRTTTLSGPGFRRLSALYRTGGAEPTAVVRAVLDALSAAADSITSLMEPSS